MMRFDICLRIGIMIQHATTHSLLTQRSQTAGRPVRVLSSVPAMLQSPHPLGSGFFASYCAEFSYYFSYFFSYRMSPPSVEALLMPG